ncbi:hypothetical protein LF1_20720 [Rubripirellula obstinata]|uniref:Uncharacterized protein n=1 Tax=Rubripirellula obstinata TaxID=406547 RepID=A0A5B1CEG5_9BACT|nr:hypothetical protein [Rubripirellula obstinata]KAA1259538.1 hypothetical protein LF1_20720 [Rubripirellula obstinata]
MLHYTDQDGWNAIRSQVDWMFRAQQPPSDHPSGAYFTTLPPDTTNLAKKLRIPRRKIEFVFCFSRTDELSQIAGGRGDFIWYSPNDYEVKKEQQNDHGKSDEGACT